MNLKIKRNYPLVLGFFALLIFLSFAVGSLPISAYFIG